MVVTLGFETDHRVRTNLCGGLLRALDSRHREVRIAFLDTTDERDGVGALLYGLYVWDNGLGLLLLLT